MIQGKKIYDPNSNKWSTGFWTIDLESNKLVPIWENINNKKSIMRDLWKHKKRIK